MNWQAIRFNCQIFSAVGVTASLIYVGLQVRQNTRTMHATSIEAHISSANIVRQQIVDNAKVADIYTKGLANPDEPTEQEKFASAFY